MLGISTRLPSLDTEIDGPVSATWYAFQLEQARIHHGQLHADAADPAGDAQVFSNTCETSSPLLRPGQAGSFESVWTLLTRQLLLQNAFARPPVESRESSWLKGKLTEGRVRCQSAYGNVSRSICWLVPTGQKANICFAETKHFHLKTVRWWNHNLIGSFLPLGLLEQWPPVPRNITPPGPAAVTVTHSFACWQMFRFYNHATFFEAKVVNTFRLSLPA